MASDGSQAEDAQQLLDELEQLILTKDVQAAGAWPCPREARCWSRCRFWRDVAEPGFRSKFLPPGNAQAAKAADVVALHAKLAPVRRCAPTLKLEPLDSRSSPAPTSAPAEGLIAARSGLWRRSTAPLAVLPGVKQLLCMAATPALQVTSGPR